MPETLNVGNLSNLSFLRPAHEKKVSDKPKLPNGVIEDTAHLAVSGYFEGDAFPAGGKVLQSVSDLQELQHTSHGQLAGTVAASRRARWIDSLVGSAITLPGLAIVGLGVFAGIATSSLMAGLNVSAFSLPFLMLGTDLLASGLHSTGLKSNNILRLGRGVEQLKSGSDNLDRLKHSLESSAANYPRALQVCYLHGHGGDGKRIAGLDVEDVGRVLKQHKVDLTVVHSCCCCQLEVLSKMSPGAGLVLASAGPISTIVGWQPKKMFGDKALKSSTPEELAVAVAQGASGRSFSLNVIDAGKFEKELLPCLDSLGIQLLEEQRGPNQKSIRQALADAHGSFLGLGPHVDLGSFLKELAKQPISQATRKEIEQAAQALQSSTTFHKNDRGMTFSLEGDASLPEGWNAFLRSTGFKNKPLLGF